MDARQLLAEHHIVHGAEFEKGGMMERLILGKYFEDFVVGEKLTSAGRTIGENTIDFVKQLTGNAVRFPPHQRAKPSKMWQQII